MRLRNKIALIFIIIIFIAFSAAYIFAIVAGKGIIVSKLNEFADNKVTLGGFSVKPPFTLKFYDVAIEGVGKIDKVLISPSIIGLLHNDLAFNRIIIVRPHFSFQRSVAMLEDQTESATEPVKAPQESGAAAVIPELIIKRFVIEDGTIDFVDHSAGPQGLRIRINDFAAQFHNLYLSPASEISRFDISGVIPWQEGKTKGKIRASGWFNLYKKDLQMEFKVQDIDGVYLYPYYAKWVDLEKARIRSATLNFSSNIRGINNDVTAECHLELANIVRTPRPADESSAKEEKIADAVLDMLRGLDAGKVSLDFTIHTKMDRPVFGFTDIRMAFEEKINKARAGKFSLTPQNILLLPSRIFEGTIKGATHASKIMLDGAFALGHEIKDSLIGTPEDSTKQTK